MPSCLRTAPGSCGVPCIAAGRGPHHTVCSQCRARAGYVDPPLRQHSQALQTGGRRSLLDSAARMSSNISNRACPKLDFQSCLPNVFVPVTLFSENGGSALHSLPPPSLEASWPPPSQTRSARLLRPASRTPRARLRVGLCSPTLLMLPSRSTCWRPRLAAPLPGSPGHSTQGTAGGTWRVSDTWVRS